MPGATEETREIHLNWVLFCRLKIEAYKTELLSLLNEEDNSSIDGEIKTVKQKLNSLWVTHTYLNNLENMSGLAKNANRRFLTPDNTSPGIDTPAKLGDWESKKLVKTLESTPLREKDLEDLILHHSTEKFPAYGSLTSDWSYVVITSRRWTDIIWTDKKSIVPTYETIGQISKEDAESYHHWNYTRDQLIGLCIKWAEGFKKKPKSKF